MRLQNNNITPMTSEYYIQLVATFQAADLTLLPYLAAHYSSILAVQGY
jgi:hypothetical protein